MLKNLALALSLGLLPCGAAAKGLPRCREAIDKLVNRPVSEIRKTVKVDQDGPRFVSLGLVRNLFCKSGLLGIGTAQGHAQWLVFIDTKLESKHYMYQFTSFAKDPNFFPEKAIISYRGESASVVTTYVAGNADNSVHIFQVLLPESIVRALSKDANDQSIISSTNHFLIIKLENKSGKVANGTSGLMREFAALEAESIEYLAKSTNY